LQFYIKILPIRNDWFLKQVLLITVLIPLLISCSSDKVDLQNSIINVESKELNSLISGDLIVSPMPSEEFLLSGSVFKKSPLPLVWPYEDMEITSPYGFRLHPVLQTVKYHRGLDFARALGTDVYSIGKGVVIKCFYHSLFGNLVEVDHGNGLISQYAHLSEITVVPGDLVEAGSLVGLTGSTGRSTGSHLHLGIIAGGHSCDPFYFLGRTWNSDELKTKNIPWVFSWRNN
jgi:murein DD-endopeptidase MepM/ murein hydrolase activator NlpD